MEESFARRYDHLPREKGSLSSVEITELKDALTEALGRIESSTWHCLRRRFGCNFSPRTELTFMNIGTHSHLWPNSRMALTVIGAAQSVLRPLSLLSVFAAQPHVGHAKSKKRRERIFLRDSPQRPQLRGESIRT